MLDTSSNKFYMICIILIGSLILNSCGLKPITSDYTFIKKDVSNLELEDLGNGNVLIYNGADILHKMDNTARLNVWIGHKAIGQLKPSEYAIINLESGPYQVRLLHLDVFNMKSEHEVLITKDTRIIKVKPNLTSNKLWVTNEFPKRWDKFTYAQN